MANTMPVREDGIKDVTFIATAVMLQYIAVVLDAGTPEGVKIAAANDAIIGITQRDADVSGEFIAVKSNGFSLAAMDAAVTINDELTVGASGQLKTAIATNVVVARATQSVGAQGEIGEVLLVTPYVKP